MRYSKTQTGRSLAGVLRERLPEIEQRIGLGWSLEALHRELVMEGYEQGFEGFRSALRRARSGLRVEAPARPVHPASVPTPAPPASDREPDYFKRRSMFHEGSKAR